MAAGVPMLQAIEITGKTAGNRVVEKAMADVIESVKQRRHDRRAAARTPRSSRGWSSRWSASARRPARSTTMLSKIADFYEDEVDAAVKALTSILEPLMIIVVGGIVGFIVISMYLPLFKVYDNIR